MPRVLVPLAQGCEDLEAVTIINVLRRAGMELLSAGLESGPVKGARGLQFIPDSLLEDVKTQDFDLVVLPGGQPGTDNLRRDPRIRELILRHRDRGAWIAAVCAAPLVLADAGLLKGKKATSYPGALDSVAHGGALVDAPVVVDGKLITGRSAGMSLDFSLALVEALLGGAKRIETEDRMVRR
jgi:4-methyl-5(b-hydroxyethyl)-thiazole monophosphate biosynthesis